MITKLVEIRDAGTFIPALAIKLEPACEEDRYLLAKAGYGLTPADQREYVLLAQVNGGRGQITCDVELQKLERELAAAQVHIQKLERTLLDLSPRHPPVAMSRKPPHRAPITPPPREPGAFPAADERGARHLTNPGA